MKKRNDHRYDIACVDGESKPELKEICSGMKLEII